MSSLYDNEPTPKYSFKGNRVLIYYANRSSEQATLGHKRRRWNKAGEQHKHSHRIERQWPVLSFTSNARVRYGRWDQQQSFALRPLPQGHGSFRPMPLQRTSDSVRSSTIIASGLDPCLFRSMTCFNGCSA